MKTINYKKVINQFRRKYPDIYFCIEEEDVLLSYAGAYANQRLVVLIPNELDLILQDEEDLKFVILHEVGHCETYHPATFTWGSLRREYLADKYACLNGSSPRNGIRVLKQTAKFISTKRKRQRIQARIKNLEKLTG